MTVVPVAPITGMSAMLKRREVDALAIWEPESENSAAALGSDALVLQDRRVYRELIRWMAADFGFDELDAYMLLTQCGRVRLGNMVDPKYSLGASILKSYL